VAGRSVESESQICMYVSHRRQIYKLQPIFLQTLALIVCPHHYWHICFPEYIDFGGFLVTACPEIHWWEYNVCWRIIKYKASSQCWAISLYILKVLVQLCTDLANNLFSWLEQKHWPSDITRFVACCTEKSSVWVPLSGARSPFVWVYVTCLYC